METITYGSEGGGKCKRTRPTLLFFMVMPALIGGFFRRGRFVIVCTETQTPVSVPMQNRKESRLNAAVTPNEVLL